MKDKKVQLISAKSPVISVLFPVYNGSLFIGQAIQSILEQTYDNFEIIIINDGSTDESAAIIQKYKDSRIRFYEQENQGLAATLNHAIKMSKGKYLARQDQDDISLPQRFEKQVDFLESHPDYGMVGTWASIMGENGDTQRIHRHPTESLILKFDLFFNNPFVHSSMMIRKSVFEKVGLYSTDKSRQPPEDYELWSRIAREFEVANIPEILHIYREVPSSMSRDGINPFLDKLINISAENLAWISGKPNQDKNITDLMALVHGASHRLSSKPSFRGMSRILYNASDKLSDSLNVQHNILRDRARLRLQSISLASPKYRYGKILGGIMERIYRIRD
jgi:glycosyltransferase involved in cell wall biosynthesis